MARRAVPPFRSKYSKHTFTQHQHIVLNLLKIKFALTYRELVELLEEMSRVKRVLKLKRVPHFTTVHKAFNRLPTFEWRNLLRISSSLFPKEDDAALGMDASGYERFFARGYYTKRAHLKISCIKSTILVE
jgi:iron only hydrogenase large subunit-like protein